MTRTPAEEPGVKERSDRFAAAAGRRPRIYVTPIDGEGSDRNIKSLAADFAGLGFDVDINTRAQTPQQVARAAVENDVHVVGLTGMRAGHEALLRQLVQTIEQEGAGTILIAFWGQDISEESQNGTAPMILFPKRMPRETCAAKILDVIFANFCVDAGKKMPLKNL